MQWVVAVGTFTILYGLARVLHAVWDAGYWGLVLLVPPAILGCAWVVASEEDRQMFREDLNWWSNWLRRRR